jgi:L-fuculose-phosphate aldolase
MSKVEHKFVSNVVRQALAQCVPGGNGQGSPMAKELFDSPLAQSIKKEIIQVGRKLWERQYVDGNGGNISYRISHDYALCTPTMCSKGDLTLDDICLVSLQNQKVIGNREHTSEILLHLEIYNSVPNARAVIHCHPPHATAYAITGLIPPGLIVPEQEVFVGRVALSPYETPGTKAFAETILPYAESHNTILLENHGVVCWADTVTHAEWCVEVIDTYCRTLMLAAQLGAPIKEIPAAKIIELLEIKKKLGLPDARFATTKNSVIKAPPSTKTPTPKQNVASRGHRPAETSFDSLVASITDQVIRFLSD